MENAKRKIFLSVVEFILLAGLMAVVPLIVVIDTVVIGHGTQEISVTECKQGALILLSAILFGIAAWKRPKSRGFLVLFAGFFGCMFIRECDFLFEKIARGFWVYPAILLAVSTILYSIRCRSTIAYPMVAYGGTKCFAYISIGLLIVLVFSRVFGTGNLWREIMCDNYQSRYKDIIQESLELLGYVLIFFGSVLFLFQKEVVHLDHTPTEGGDETG